MNINNLSSSQAVSSHLHGEVQTPAPKSSSVHNNLASHYTSLGTSSKVTVGKGLTTTLKWLTLSAPARKLGNAIQGGNDSHAPSTKGKARYWTGAVIKGLANITGGASSVVSGVVSVTASAISNLADAAIRLVKASRLGLAAGGAKAMSKMPIASSDRLNANNHAKELWQAAKAEITPSFVQKAKQETLTPEGARQVVDAAQLARVSCSSSYREMPEGYQHASHLDIPESVLAKRAGSSGGTGQALTLHVRAGVDSNAPLILEGDKWSALKVAVYKRDETLILAFVGTQPSKRPATLKSDAAVALGIKDSAFQDADKLVKEFSKMHDGKVELIGHSLGGGIAQYAGIKHGVKVNAFNSMGLHVNLRDRLADKLDAANVTHVNTSHDPLSQIVENGYTGLDASSQVGKRYVIANSGGHRMENVTAGLDKLLE